MSEVLVFPSGQQDDDSQNVAGASPDLKTEVIRGIQLLAQTDERGNKVEMISPLRQKSAENIISILEKVL